MAIHHVELQVQPLTEKPGHLSNGLNWLETLMRHYRYGRTK